MHVAQLPASHENGGRRPPRRAVSSTVSPAWYAHRVLPAVEPDHQRLGRRRRSVVDGRVVGDDEPLDEHLRRRDAEHREAGFDGVHVRAGTADVEVGVRALADERRALRGIEEAALGVEVMMHREPVAGRRAQAARARRAKITESALAVRVHEQDRARRGASALLMIEITGVMPLPPANATIGTSRVVQHEEPGRAHHVDRRARRERVVHPVRHAAAGHALHRRGERVAGVGRARHRVAAHDRLAVDRRPERAELPGRVRERRARAPAGSRARTTGCRRSRRRRRPPRAGGTRGRAASADPRSAGSTR